MLGCDQLGEKCVRGFVISARGRVVVVVSLPLWCCVNKNLRHEEAYAAATQGKKSHYKIYREWKLVKSKINSSKTAHITGTKENRIHRTKFGNHEHATTHKQNTGIINTVEAFTRKTAKGQGPEKTPLV